MQALCWFLELFVAAALSWHVCHSGDESSRRLRLKAKARWVAVVFGLLGTATLGQLATVGGFVGLCSAFVINLVIAGTIAFTTSWVVRRLA